MPLTRCAIQSSPLRSLRPIGETATEAARAMAYKDHHYDFSLLHDASLAVRKAKQLHT